MAMETEDPEMLLDMEDGSFHQGYGFGAPAKSISGELVFQTGMVGYSESITDPSYRGQILVITYPLVGNYGVPSRETKDDNVQGLSAHFESSQIHVAGLVVSSYAGEDYSHHLATSSLGTWLKEQGIPAMYGVDTRTLTKKIRDKGSMLGKLLARKQDEANGIVNGVRSSSILNQALAIQTLRARFREIEWTDPNRKNLVADGKELQLCNILPEV